MKRASTQAEPDWELGWNRLVFFSDAVMAIAITLLAVNIRVPQLAPPVSASQLGSSLGAMLPQALSFLISFIVIGVYWMAHHRYFGYIKRYDARLMWLNLLFLLFIVVLPFFSTLLGSYGSLPVAETLYALVIAGIGLSMLAMWAYASHDHRLVDEKLDPGFIRGTFPLAVATPVIFLASIPVAFVQPGLAPLVWWLVPILGLGWRLVRRTRR